eukprot:8763465-Heterocapsa_arctica.AAC.1
MLYLGVARSRAAFPTGVSKAGAFSTGAAWGSVACTRLAGGSGTACLAAIAIWAPIPNSMRRNAGLS